MAYDAESDRVILLGGWKYPEYQLLDDTWAYDFNTNTWTQMNPAVAPGPRHDSAMVYDAESDRIILFGGSYWWPWRNDTWAYDFNTNTWTQMNPAVAPGERKGHAMAYDAENDRVILFGGHYYPGDAAFADTWAYDLNTDTWTQRSPAVAPSGRYASTMAYDVESDRILMFGGLLPWGPQLADTWTYDCGSDSWQQMSPSAAPGPRHAASSVYDAQSDRVVLFGGTGEGSLLGDTWLYDQNSARWTEVASTVAPTPRQYPMAAYDASSDRLVLFGGADSSGDLEEAWVFAHTPDADAEEPFVQACASQTFVAPDGAANDNFGAVAALSGNWGAFSASLDDNEFGIDAGAVYLYRRSGAVWNFARKLLAWDGQSRDFFGYKVQMAGEWLAVAAPQNARGGNGAVYLFRFDGTDWQPAAKLTALDGHPGAMFGQDLALAATRLVVTAYGHSQPLPFGGAAYVFEFNGTSWSQTSKLVPWDPVAGQGFGADVALGSDRIVVGAVDEWLGYIGAAYVFRYDGAGWVQEAKLMATSPQYLDYYYHVAIDDDVLTVGADQRWGWGSGFVEVWRRTGTSWTREAHLEPSDGTAGDSFCEMVLDGEHLAVASMQMAGMGRSGVYLFQYGAGGWNEIQKVTSADYPGIDYFGGIGFGFAGRDLWVGAGGSNGNTGNGYAFALGPDCNGNGVADACDIMDGTSSDANDDGEPDECGPPDADADGIADGFDNCPNVANPAQADTDADAAGDLCDPCPADALNGCKPLGSVAGEISAKEGGKLVSPDGSVALDFPSWAVSATTTVSATEMAFNDPAVNLVLAKGTGKGQQLRLYRLEPVGAAFAELVTLTITADVSHLNDKQAAALTLYLEITPGRLEPISGATCDVGNGVATCTAEISHFSVYALVAPFDGDGDGLFDRFGDLVDVCPAGPNVIDGFLSPLAALVPIDDPLVLPDRPFKAGRTLPLKLDYRCGAVPLTDQDDVTPPALLAVWRIGDAAPLPAVDLDSGNANDEGAWFRYSGEHWIYNLKSTDLEPGTYEVHVRMPDGRVFKGGFAIR